MFFSLLLFFYLEMLIFIFVYLLELKQGAMLQHVVYFCHIDLWNVPIDQSALSIRLSHVIIIYIFCETKSRPFSQSRRSKYRIETLPEQMELVLAADGWDTEARFLICRIIRDEWKSHLKTTGIISICFCSPSCLPLEFNITNITHTIQTIRG